MVDFDRAVAAGMALAIPLTAEQYATGFTRLLVLGLQLGTAANDWPGRRCRNCSPTINGAAAASSSWPQGTPAHNATGTKRRSTPDDDADAALTIARIVRCSRRSAIRTQKRDGQWLAEFLGLDPAFVASVHGSGGVDQMQARAMQTALWPATLGYWMNTLFTPNPGTTSIFSGPGHRADPRVLHLVRLRPRPAASNPHRRPALRHPSRHGVLAHPVVPEDDRLGFRSRRLFCGAV